MKFLKLLTSLIIPGIAAATSVCRILSLSGGGSHGAFEAGVLQSITERPDFQPWDVYLGVSAGGLSVLSLTKDNFKDNMNVVRDMWFETKTKDIIEPLSSGNSLSGNGKIYKLIQSTHKQMSGSPSSGYFGVGTTDLSTGTFMVRDIDTTKINFDDFVASAAIPIVFPPVSLADAQHQPVGSLVDGGLQKNEIFLSGLEYCNERYDSVVMDLVFANYESEQDDPGPWSLWNIAKRSLDLIKEDFDNMYFKSVSSCSNFKSTLQLTVNLIMPPSPITVSVLDFNQGDMLWNLGYFNHSIKTITC